MQGFGAFCDIGAGISALLPVDSIGVRIHPQCKFTINQNIRAIIKSFDSDGRVSVPKGLLGT